MTRSNEAFELLRAANPVPRAGEPRTRWRRTRVALVLAVLALCLLIVAPAVGIEAPRLDFWKAEKAPGKVVQDFESLSEGAPPGMDPGAISGETRKVRLAGGHTLWVAPTRHGGFCTSGGCDKLGSVPLSVSWEAGRVAPGEMTRPFPSATIFDRITGHVNGMYADDVEIRFADGDRHRLDLAWVSEPINAGFFRYEVPAERRRAGHEIESIVALDADGRVVTQDAQSTRLAVPPPDALVDDTEAGVRLVTSRGEAVVWEAPTRYEGRCAWLEYLGRGLGFLPCMPRGYDWGFSVRFVPTRSNVLVVGAMRPHVAEVEIQFRDGERMVVTPAKGFLLAELPRRQLVAGREATTIVLRDRDGKTVAPRIPVAGLRADDESCYGPLPLREERRGPGCLSD